MADMVFCHHNGIDYQNVGNPDVRKYQLISERFVDWKTVRPLVIPFIAFIDGTLVARNSVEAISLCPAILNHSMRNLAKSTRNKLHANSSSCGST